MGINAAGAQFLLSARASGVDFSRTATLGRQSFFPTEKELRPVAEAFQLRGGAAAVLSDCGRSGDRFLQLLGAESVTSFDANNYEGASVIHDMNEPVPREHHGRYSAVIDGGTLEHILTCFRFFGQVILLFWTARGELSDVESQVAQAA